MLKLTATCERCGKIKELDVTGHTLNDDHIRKIGFAYICGKLICKKCQSEFSAYKRELDEKRKKCECDFLKFKGEEEDKK